MRTAIVGAGSMGMIIGALMAKNGGQVDLIGSNLKNIQAIQEKGVTVTGYMNFTTPVNAITPNQLTGQYDLVLLITKQTETQAKLPPLLPFLHDESIVCPLQNGIPETLVASIVGEKRTIGGIMGFGATYQEPGISKLTSIPETVTQHGFMIGEINGEITERIQAVKAVLALAGGTTVLANLMGIRWSKLLMNATFSGMSASLGCHFGAILDNDRAMICIANLADEVIKVCHASGHKMVTMNTLDMETLALSSPQDITNKIPIFRRVWERHRGVSASMLYDLKKGRPCEIDYINGLVSTLGKEKNIPTPFNDKVVELVKKAEANQRINDFSALSAFDDLINSLNI